MNKMITIVVTVVLIFGVSAQPALGRVVDLPFADPVQPNVMVYGGLELEPTFWAQNDTGENETGESSKTETDTKKTESTDEEKDQTSKSKPLEPFIPSEKIPGEQAVDFPVDI